MTVVRVFPRKTRATPVDDMAVVGDPPMFRPPATEVHISVAFSWDRARAERLRQAWQQYYPVVKLGGPAYEDPGADFILGVYVKPDIVFTSRGCNNQCPWCLAWRREGKVRELAVQAGNIVQDNNLLQCSRAHITNVFEMLRTQRAVQFAGGLDPRLVTDQVAEDLRGLRIRQLFLSCDTEPMVKPLATAVKRLGLPRDKLRCYVLIGFNGESLDKAEERLRATYDLGCLPFAQLYQPPGDRITYPREWRELTWVWSRPAAIMAEMRGHGKKGPLRPGGGF